MAPTVLPALLDSTSSYPTLHATLLNSSPMSQHSMKASCTYRSIMSLSMMFRPISPAANCPPSPATNQHQSSMELTVPPAPEDSSSFSPTLAATPPYSSPTSPPSMPANSISKPTTSPWPRYKPTSAAISFKLEPAWPPSPSSMEPTVLAAPEDTTSSWPTLPAMLLPSLQM